MTTDPAAVPNVDDYRKRPGGPPRCLMCGSRRIKHDTSGECLRDALRAIDAHHAPEAE